MFFANIRDWYSYSRKRSDYTQRIENLKDQLNDLDLTLVFLCDEANRLTRLYDVGMQLKKEKHTKGGSMGVWVLNTIKMDCVNINHRYPKRVRDFGRLSDEQREALEQLLANRDKAFVEQLLKMEKQRISINHSVNIINKILSQLEQLAKNDYPLKHILD